MDNGHNPQADEDPPGRVLGGGGVGGLQVPSQCVQSVQIVYTVYSVYNVYRVCTGPS